MKTKLVLSMMLLTAMVSGVQAQEYWTQKADFPGGNRTGAGGFSIGDKGYVGMGFDGVSPTGRSDFWQFDPTTNVWTQKADFEGGGRGYGAGFSIGNKGYYGTGIYASYNWRKDFWEYDPATNDWTQKADFGGGLRYTAVAFSIGNKGYMGTGNYRVSPYVNATYYYDFWEYDPGADSWSQKSNVPDVKSYPWEPPKGRTNATGINIGNKGYVGLGTHYYDTRLKDWWEYDPLSNSWIRKADLPGTQRTAANGFGIGNLGYVGGGYYYSPLYDLYEFNPSTNLWTLRSPIPGAGTAMPVTFSIGSKGFYGLGDSNISGQRTFYQYTPYSITVACPEDANVSTTATTCDAIVSGIDPVYTVSPAIINPVVRYTLTHNNVVYASGTGNISGMTFQKGITYAHFSIAEDPLATCQVMITVEDTVLPVIDCAEEYIYCYDATGNYAIPQLTATDNCGVNTISYIITGSTARTGTGNDATGLFEIGHSDIEWTVTDSTGNTSLCTTHVVIDGPISVTIPSVYAVNPGGELNTIYMGYGPAFLTYNTAVSGGTPRGDGSYFHQWSTGESTPSITVSPNVEGTYLYSVTVHDALGCEQFQSISVVVIDVRCGNKLDKVLICKVPPGNPDNSKVICINKIDVVNQLKNGSYLGTCSSEIVDQNFWNQHIDIFPNPNKGSFVVQLTDLNSSWCQITITDRIGKIVDTKNLNSISSPQSISFDLSDNNKGMYFIKVLSAEGVQMHKMLLE
jgi:N-acetylneuraminic acid mutarotase